MKPTPRSLLIGAVAVAAVLAAGAFIVGRAPSSMCGNRVLSRVPSPDDQLQAVVFERDCGATTDFSTQVALLRRGAPLPNEGGNVLVVDTDHGKAPSGPGGGPVVTVRWVASDSLEIGFHRRARIFRQANAMGAVRIVYSLFGEDGA